MALFRVYGCRHFLCVDTSVDFTTVQVKSTVQLHVLWINQSVFLLSCQTQMRSHSEFVELCIESHCSVRFVARSTLCFVLSLTWMMFGSSCFCDKRHFAAQLFIAVSAKNNVATLCFAFIPVVW